MADGTGTTSYTYDYAGDLTGQSLIAASGTGLSNSSVSKGYFSTGVLHTETYPAYGTVSSPVVSYAYDGTGAMTSENDWLGHKVTFAHDVNGNQTAQDNGVSTANPSGTSSTSFSYDAADQNTQAVSTLSQTCSGSNETLTQAFSGTAGSRNPDGQVTQDSESYSGSCSSPPSFQRNYSYDATGRVVYEGSSTQGSSPNTFAYDPSGDPTTISSHDASGNFDTYTQTFDAAGEVTGQGPVTGSSGSSSTYSYDTLGDQSHAVSGSSTSTYGFNQIGQMTSFTDASSTGYQYNGDGLETANTSPGLAWSGTTSVDGASLDANISCVSSTFCMAVDGNGDAMKFNGSTWSSPVDIDARRLLTAISCYSTTWCMAADATGRIVIYNGSWGSPGLLDSGKEIMALSCHFAFCMGVDSDGRALHLSGATWTISSIDGTHALFDVSCPSTSFCEAVDDSGRVLHYNGTSWSSPLAVDTTGFPQTISCTSATFCVIVDESGDVVSYNGTSWSSPSNIDGTGFFYSVSCASSSFCQAVDEAGHVLTYNGREWSSPPSDPDGVGFLKVSCPTSTFCGAITTTSSALAATYRPAPVTSQLTWDTSGSLAHLISDGTNDYIYGPSDTPVEQVNITSLPPTDNPQFMTYTASDSSWLTTNVAGDQTAFWRYDAFGNLAFGTPASPFGYAGQYQDTSSNSTGFDNMRARWFEPQTGSFTTRDPAFSDTNQAYAYAGRRSCESGRSIWREPEVVCARSRLIRGAGFK